MVIKNLDFNFVNATASCAYIDVDDGDDDSISSSDGRPSWAVVDADDDTDRSDASVVAKRIEILLLRFCCWSIINAFDAFIARW